MASDNKQLASNISKANKAMVPAAFEHDVKQWFAANQKTLKAMAGGDIRKAALHMAATFSQVNKIPQLLECKPETLQQCIIYSITMGLLPGIMNECYFLPFRNKGQMEATFIPGYQGLVKLAYNSGFVTRVTAHVVWSADDFDYDPAEEKIYHRPFRGLEKDRGERIGAYCCIKNRFGEIQPTVKWAEFINGIKKRSKASGSSFSPWNSDHPSDVDAMWLKTVFKQAAKWIPKSSSPQGLALGRALHLDDMADTGDQAANLLSDELADVNKMLDIKDDVNDNRTDSTQ